MLLELATEKIMKTKKEVSKKIVKKVAPAKKVVAKTSVSRTKAANAKKVAVKSKPAKRVVARKHQTIPAAKKHVEARKIEGKKLSSIKRAIYMAFSIVLGLLLGTFVQLFIELVYMKKMMVGTTSPQIHYFMGMSSYLPTLVQEFFLLSGLIFGIWLGFWGWRFVYVEKRHRSTRQA